MVMTPQNPLNQSFKDRLRGGRDQYADDLRASLRYWGFSAATYTLRKNLLPLVKKFVSGEVLDAGAGGLHGRQLIEKYSREYRSVDIKDRHGDLDLVADIQDLSILEADVFDCVFCSQVLEHLPHPEKALAEFHRVLRSGGHVLITVPHLSALHEEPHDYFRYTPYGLKNLMEEAGFEILELNRSGGLITFVTHPVSYVLNTVGWRIPVFRWLVWLLNFLLVVWPSVFFDWVFRTGRIWPTNIIAVGRKR